MDKYKEIIFSYIQSESSYALLFTGEWGIGKTHFIKNEIVRELEIKYDRKKCKKNKRNVKIYPVPIYVSLHGINDLLDLKKKLNLAILSSRGFRKLVGNHNKFLNFFTTGIKSMEGFVSNFIPVKGFTYGVEEMMSFLNESSLSKDNKNVVLFIDDLERMGKGVNINDCLGLISSDYMDKLGCKVIIIANEEKIDDENEKKIDNKSTFNVIKEKIIDKTVEFKQSSKDILFGVMKDKKNKFLIKNKDWISDIFIFYNESINIRTFISVVDNFIEIEKKLKKIDIEDFEFLGTKMKKSLFLNVMVITDMYKKGHLSKRSASTLIFNSRRLETTVIEDGQMNQSELLTIIKRKYDSRDNKLFSDNIFYFNSISCFVLGFEFYEEEFKESFQVWKSLFEKNSSYDKYQNLYNLRRMDDAEIEERQKAIVKSVNEDKYEFEDLLRIYKLFLEFEEMRLLFLEDDFRGLLSKKIEEKYMTIEYGFKEEGLFSMLNDGKRFVDLIILEDRLNLLSSNKIRKESLNFFEAIFEENAEVLNKYVKNVGKYLIISSLNDTLINDYLFVKNNKADLLWNYIRGSYDLNSFDDIIKSEEIEAIQNLIGKIENKVMENMQKIDKFKLHQLLESLKEIDLV